MSVEHSIDPPEPQRFLPKPTALANKFESHSDSVFGNRLMTMAQRDCIPNRAQVLGVGAVMAVLGHEIAFYRRDIHWINAAPEYDDPELEAIADALTPNMEMEAVNLELLPDVYPEKHFDRIFLYNDPPILDPATGEKLIDLLNDGGELQIAGVDKDFMPSTSYKPGKKLLIYRKPTAPAVPSPHLTKLPAEPNNLPVTRSDNLSPHAVTALSLLPFGIGDRLYKRINHARRIGRALANLPFNPY